ncbi:Basic proline-rich protein precursor [Actinosynnema pretiosum subsp. pretiosum]|nr:Basic proline-rich protein precursor [Actinosynnema pretiosum subsp. pretiosum]
MPHHEQGARRRSGRRAPGRGPVSGALRLRRSPGNPGPEP